MAINLLLTTTFLFLGLSLCTFAQAEEKRIDWYGYAQTDLSTTDEPEQAKGFRLSRVNLIGDFVPASRVRFLGDIEFEDGADHSVDRLQGTIKLSRAFLEYTFFSQLRLRAGKILTPFGLYNEVHDFTATYFSLEVPRIYKPHAFFNGLQKQRIFAKYSTGVEGFGTFDLGSDGAQLDYAVTISNGRGETLSGGDINGTPGTSLRAVYRPGGGSPWQFGASAYQDRNHEGIGGTSDDPEQTYALDVQFETSKLQIQCESALGRFSAPSGRRHTALLSYGQVAYTFFDVLTPYIQHSVERYDLRDSEGQHQETRVGTAWNFAPGFFLKGEARFFAGELQEQDINYHAYFLSAAIAF